MMGQESSNYALTQGADPFQTQQQWNRTVFQHQPMMEEDGWRLEELSLHLQTVVETPAHTQREKEGTERGGGRGRKGGRGLISNEYIRHIACRNTCSSC